MFKSPGGTEILKEEQSTPLVAAEVRLSCTSALDKLRVEEKENLVSGWILNVLESVMHRSGVRPSGCLSVPFFQL